MKRVGWVAFLDAVAPGGRTEDLAELVRRAKTLGCTDIALRIGDAGNRDGGSHKQLKGGIWVPDPLVIDTLREAGFGIIVWLFEYAQYPTQSRPIWLDWVRHADEACINAEFPYIAAGAGLARGLVKDLRNMGYKKVTHAPPDYAGARGDGALRILDEECDAIYPQVYWTEHDDSGPNHHLDNVLEGKGQAAPGYKKRGLENKTVPLGVTYRPNFRGSHRVGDRDIPTPLKPIGDKAVADMVVDFLKHPWAKAAEQSEHGLHFYSLDGLTFAGEGREAVLEAVQAYDAEQDPYKGAPYTGTPSMDPNYIQPVKTEVPNATDTVISLAEEDDDHS